MSDDLAKKLLMWLSGSKDEADFYEVYDFSVTEAWNQREEWERDELRFAANEMKQFLEKQFMSRS